MTTRPWQRQFGFFLPDGTTPLVQTGLSLGSFAGGDSLLRSRVTLELYVEAVSSTGNLVNFLAMNACEVGMGYIAYDSSPGASASPLTDPENPAGSLGWLTWSIMYPTVNFFKESDVETATWTWRTDPITMDVQTRRRTTVGLIPTHWLAWEIIDQSGSNFLNNTVAGTTYALGARWAVSTLFETFP